MRLEVPEGTEVFIRHYRYVDDETYGLMPAKVAREAGYKFIGKGGMTEANVKLPDGRKAIGLAVCRQNEAFNKKIGRNIAVGRALKQLK